MSGQSPAGELWSAARYESVADRLAPLADVLLDEVEAAGGPLRGRTLLDVGAGTGNVAVAAAARGADVTALDPAHRLLDVAAARAARLDLPLKVVPGDAHALPFPDGSFDAVVSCVGVVFATDRATAAAELRRVTAPGGVVSVLAWRPAQPDDPFLAPVVAAFGAPAPGTPSPTDWGVPEVARELLAGGPDGGPVTARTGEHTWRFADVAEALALLADSPMHSAVLSGLDREGRDRFARTAADAFACHAVTDGIEVRSPYLVTTARRP